MFGHFGCGWKYPAVCAALFEQLYLDYRLASAVYLRVQRSGTLGDDVFRCTRVCSHTVHVADI